jgi:hypothetical protein
MSFGSDPGATGEARRKAEVFTARAEAASARRLAGRRPLVLRLIGRLLRRGQERGGPRAG